MNTESNSHESINAVIASMKATQILDTKKVYDNDYTPQESLERFKSILKRLFSNMIL